MSRDNVQAKDGTVMGIVENDEGRSTELVFEGSITDGSSRPIHERRRNNRSKVGRESAFLDGPCQTGKECFQALGKHSS
jgi:hypothetical protein